jgi:hypothetical protein
MNEINDAAPNGCGLKDVEKILASCIFFKSKMKMKL